MMDFKLGLMGGGGGGGGFNRNNNSNGSSSSDKSSSKCRPLSEVFPGGGAQDMRGSSNSKMARTDSFSSNHSSQNLQQQQQQQQTMMMMGRSLSSSGKLLPQPCSPTDSTAASDDVLLGRDSANGGGGGGSSSSIHGDQQQQVMLPPPPSSTSSLLSASSLYHSQPAAAGNNLLRQLQQQQQQQQQQMRLQQFHQPDLAFQYKQAGLPLAMMGGSSSSTLMSLHEASFGPRYPFTSIQWAELEHQALVFKYMMARAPVPPELIAPIRKSLASINAGASGWGGGSFPVGGAPSPAAAAGHTTNHLDAEPGRCRRTDGKKWRCARPIVPDQKYCERHINRGRHKKKGNSNSNTATTTISATTNTTNSSQQQQQAAVVALPSTAQIHGLAPAAAAPQHQNCYETSQRAANQMMIMQQNPAVAPPTSMVNPHQQQQMMRSYNNNGVSGCGAGQFQVPMQSSYNASLSMKDRVLNGISKATFDLRPEQLLFSEVSGSARASLAGNLQQQQQHVPPAGGGGGGAGMQGLNQIALQMHLSQMKSNMTSISSSSNYAESPYSRFCQSDEADHYLSSFLQQQQQQQQQQHQPVYQLDEEIDRKPDAQALRQLFNEWPRSRDASTMTSWSDSEENEIKQQKHKLGGHSTHLSISIPETSGNDSDNKMVKLSMASSSRGGGEDVADSATNKSVIGSSSSSELGWFSAARASVGGPLAEAFNASEAKSAGFSFLLGSSNHHHHQGNVLSPTGVLQKATLGCFSESSSASSPGSIKVENAALS